MQSQEKKLLSGNDALDIILASRSAYCTCNDISFTVVADGARLEFMDTADVSALTGNALDEVIERAVRHDAVEKRLVHSAIFKWHDFLVMRFESYDNGSACHADGTHIPTGKKVRFKRLKVIKSIADKYNGSVSASVVSQWFKITVLVPIPSGF